ncbi:hypothetical protein [Brachybacterium saurashtrense]|uniref:Uncharacterized protein n=1 Tax=Brachybacterium saurashtrense TaxID=556288 RepID=A0A345YSE3_9MICO|nr:hypothetical protein [Brachybacterium saurashtrense]AXK46845.1 hypothetical protein DWV08_15310 [Brachybacterium saurashtrense]RRR22560.1 hypothetical protein DXU92_09930 [Brachybacterium saurashtrense]
MDMSRRPSRRTVLRAASWSAPVVAVAVAAPALALSDPLRETFDFYITAAEVIGDGASGEVRSNGVRVSPRPGQGQPIVAAGSIVEITCTYTGDNPDVDFLNFPFPYTRSSVAQNNTPWKIASSSAQGFTLRAETPYDTFEPTIGQFSWPLDPSVRPEDDSIQLSGTFTIIPGGDFPEGGTLSPLTIDPNLGTGSLTGPSAETWPEN